MSITWGAVQTPNEFNAPAEGLAKLTGHYCTIASPLRPEHLEKYADLPPGKHLDQPEVD